MLEEARAYWSALPEAERARFRFLHVSTDEVYGSLSPSDPPFAETNRQWLQNDRRTSPVWIAGKKYWELPKAWFNDFVERSLVKYGKVYVIQPYREQEKCSPA